MTSTGFLQLPIDAPPFRPSAYGLLQVAAVSDNSALRALAGGTFPTNTTRAMTATLITAEECGNPFDEPKNDNILEEWLDAYPIAGYGWWQCSTGGYTVEEAQALAAQRYLAGESRTLEGVLWDDVLTGAACTPATTLVGTLAAAEDALALYYGGEGVIHMSRGTATLLGADVLMRVGSTLRTVASYTPVVVGDGYTDLNVVAISGAITVVRGPLDSLTPNPAAAIDRARNNLTGIVERSYLVAIDDPVACFSVAP